MANAVMIQVRIEIALMLCISLTSAALIMMVLHIIMWRSHRKAQCRHACQPPEVIEVFESPEPTRMKSTPRSSPFMTHRRDAQGREEETKVASQESNGLLQPEHPT